MYACNCGEEFTADLERVIHSRTCKVMILTRELAGERLKLDSSQQEVAKLNAEMKRVIDAGLGKIEGLELQVEALREALQHQKEIWDVALPWIKEVDSAHGFVPFDALHRPIWKIDKALAGSAEKRKCAESCAHDDVTMGWCVEWQRGKFEELHCKACCETPSCWERA